jgi:simple sugar transport system ATP-binding protein
MTEPLIELRNVSKHFAGVRALTDVSIAVHPGEVVCLLGDNGAGKSTLIKILSGFHPPSSGSIYLDRRPASPTRATHVRAASPPSTRRWERFRS